MAGRGGGGCFPVNKAKSSWSPEFCKPARSSRLGHLAFLCLLVSCNFLWRALKCFPQLTSRGRLSQPERFSLRQNSDGPQPDMLIIHLCLAFHENEPVRSINRGVWICYILDKEPQSSFSVDHSWKGSFLMKEYSNSHQQWYVYVHNVHLNLQPTTLASSANVTSTLSWTSQASALWIFFFFLTLTPTQPNPNPYPWPQHSFCKLRGHVPRLVDGTKQNLKFIQNIEIQPPG